MTNPKKPATVSVFVKKPVVSAADNLAKARAARVPVDPKESPEARFKRLANPRLIKACSALESLCNVAVNNGKKITEGDAAGTTTGYLHTPEQTAAIEAALKPLMMKLMERLRGEKKADGPALPTL